MRQTELLEAGQELLQVLAPEGAKDQLGGRRATAPAHRGQDEAGEIGVIDGLNGLVSPR